MWSVRILSNRPRFKGGLGFSTSRCLKEPNLSTPIMNQPGLTECVPCPWETEEQMMIGLPPKGFTLCQRDQVHLWVKNWAWSKSYILKALCWLNAAVQGTTSTENNQKSKIIHIQQGRVQMQPRGGGFSSPVKVPFSLGFPKHKAAAVLGAYFSTPSWYTCLHRFFL